MFKAASKTATVKTAGSIDGIGSSVDSIGSSSDGGGGNSDRGNCGKRAVTTAVRNLAIPQ